MGELETDHTRRQIIIHSDLYTYGEAADVTLTEQIREEIETLWNEPEAVIQVNEVSFRIVFRIKAYVWQQISPREIRSNVNPRNNYFRIEEYASGNISFVDGLKSNTGYFKRDNLISYSTTAAHEYGHTLGLDHPETLDLRGGGQPGIMHPRGTLVDAHLQWNPLAKAGEFGGTLQPKYRKVLPEEIAALDLGRLLRNGRTVLGRFTNVYHEAHQPEGRIAI